MTNEEREALIARARETIGPKPRPWRLTRRQRVEMEAALARLRLGVLARRVERLQIAFARHCVGGAPMFAIDGYVSIDTPRLLRARVAIALRAALRADEDARCEESWAMMGTVRLPREWPGCMIFQGSAVPLALWERAR